MKLFVSYRRADSMHPAQRVRMHLQKHFGDEAVFIDRVIPAGQPWQQYLRTQIEECTGLVVLIGAKFESLLKRPTEPTPAAVDQMVWEIRTALELGKPIYPVVVDRHNTPSNADLPPEIHALTRFQAVFAHDPVFDAAMATLVRDISVAQGWDRLDTTGPAWTDTPTSRPALWPWCWLAWLFAGLICWGAGRLVLWLADPDGAAAWPAEAAFWYGLEYVLATSAGGLGPYLGYRLVAQLRALARLPIHNLHGILSTCHVSVMLVAGAAFLLLSTLPGWKLVPLWVFPQTPQAHHYVGLALALLTLVLVTVAVAIWEPKVRRLAPAQRGWRMHVINLSACVTVVSALWFIASLAHSLPALGARDPVPVVGYLMLCPALSVLMLAWQMARSMLGVRELDWPIRGLFGLVAALYVVCTLALFAYGPMRLLVLVQ